MMFNTTKCKVMHIGKKSVHSQYFMNNHQLDEVKEEKYLEILISHDLKDSQQCQLAYNKASWILGLINHTIEYKHPDILIHVYKSLVMARYRHKGHDTIRYHTKYRDTIQYDMIQKCFTVCKNRLLSVTNYSYIVAAPFIFTAPTRSFEVGHVPTSWAAPPDTVLVWVNVSVVTVNRTKTAVFCYLKASSSTRRFKPKMAQCLRVFIFW